MKTNEPLLTRFLVYETTDGGRTLHYRGTQDATHRDAAVRLLFSEPVREIEGFYAAISENALKIKPVSIKPRTSIGTEIPLPTSPEGASQAPLSEEEFASATFSV